MERSAGLYTDSTPTLLTILGVIMYLRVGRVVGNTGLLGALLIISLAFAITFCTGLSLSSITTNIRIGTGGAFSAISQSLGLEVGGSVGIPLYLAQALAVSMYIFGFRAGWLWIFPDHAPMLVDLGTFVVLFTIAFISTSLAFKIQYVILVTIIVSLVSDGASVFTTSWGQNVQWWGAVWRCTQRHVYRIGGMGGKKSRKPGRSSREDVEGKSSCAR